MLQNFINNDFMGKYLWGNIYGEISNIGTE